MIQVNNVVKTFDGFRALDGLTMSVEGGSIYGLVGPNGAGKSTILRHIMGVYRPDSGSILVEGRELTRLKRKELTRFRRERLGFIFQDCNLLDTLTAFENIALSLSIVGTPAGEIRPRVEETAQLLGIGDCLDKYPYQMSGGQQQRCAAARAIVTRPALVLADEPTGALDSKTGRHVLEILHTLNQEGSTIILITHDNGIAATAHRVVRISDGRIVADGTREEVGL